LNQLRIIGGKWKRRKLSFPDRPSLRPSLGRLRETLFNWLVGEIEGRTCLDLYAGSGALGFEALSRGAAHVTFVDEDAEAIKHLHRNRVELDAGDCRIVRARALPWLRREQAQWGLVFLDPPFDSRELEQVLPALRALTRVRADSLVYLEFAAHREPSLEGWLTLKSTRAGDARALLLQPVP
jgi:16S rRNA (guanine966-N2)-methyltransferase